jgi:hypothetical protein
VVKLPGLPAAQGLSDVGLADELRRVQREASRLEARRAELIAEADRRGLPARQGFGSTTAWLVVLSGDPAAVCRSRLGVAESLQEMPETKAAFAAGDLPESRVRLLAQVRESAPEQFARDEAALVAQATAASSQRLPQVLHEWRRATDPEGAEADTERAFARRALRLSPGLLLGMLHIDGDLDAESGTVVQTALRALSEPGALDPADDRTPAQRRADALVEICRRHLDGTPGSASRRPHLSVTVPWETLQQGHGLVATEVGPISAETARRLACDATVSRLVLQPDGSPAQAGQSRRVIPPALRRALHLRDQGCTHPGCDMPARFCDAHHIVHWADGGKTEMANPSI